MEPPPAVAQRQIGLQRGPVRLVVRGGELRVVAAAEIGERERPLVEPSSDSGSIASRPSVAASAPAASPVSPRARATSASAMRSPGSRRASRSGDRARGREA
jgi:hypothetical protein